jgi:L-alanine-DL-glutamate epimerase-like enolase superfamily enzyme
LTDMPIAGVDVMTIQAQLPAPVIFGDWVMNMREFALVRVRTAGDAPDGFAYTLTRDGAVAEQIRKTIGPIYTGTSVEDRESTFTLAWRRSLASHSAGLGLRALSIVDLACWDLAAKLADRSIADFLGGHNGAMPATAIIGYPPGDAASLAELRTRTDVPIAQGDEQGGSYYPDALIRAEAVDVVRVDLTCMGGITAGRRVIDETLDAGLAFAPHMFPHIHSQVLAAWGFTEVPIEWGIPDTGVHPMDDPLPQPQLTAAGLMRPLEEGPGFGHIVDADWMRSQPHDDPDAILDDL